MKMKTGINIIVIAASVAAGIYIGKNKNRKTEYNHIGGFDIDDKFTKAPKRIRITEEYNPSNSFIEFFSKNNLKEAYSRYDKYLDLGLNKDDAFKAVVEDDRNS